jgi:hypothetical protein
MRPQGTGENSWLSSARNRIAKPRPAWLHGSWAKDPPREDTDKMQIPGPMLAILIAWGGWGKSTVHFKLHQNRPCPVILTGHQQHLGNTCFGLKSASHYTCQSASSPQVPKWTPSTNFLTIAPLMAAQCSTALSPDYCAFSFLQLPREKTVQPMSERESFIQDQVL